MIQSQRAGSSINDSRDTIHTKLKSALTDSIDGVSYDPENRPGVSNLLDLLYCFDKQGAASPAELGKDLHDMSMAALKEQVADAVDEGIKEIREKV